MQLALELSCDGFSRVDDLYFWPCQFPDQRLHDRIMGTTKHNQVCALLMKRLDIARQQLAKAYRVQLALFDLSRESGAGLGYDAPVPGKTALKPAEFLT